MAVGEKIRWFGVGGSVLDGAAEAGAQAAQGAMAAGEDPKLLVVFASSQYDLRELLDAVNDASGDVPLIGCSTAGEISASGPGNASVVVTAIGGEGFEVETAIADAGGGLREAGAEAAKCAAGLPSDKHTALLLLTDGLAGDQQEVLRGAYSVVGATVPLVGGCAGDDLAMERTFQFRGREVVSGGVVAAALSSEAPFGIGVRHGWRRVGDPMLVTRSAGTRVLELDGRPALDAYLDRLQAPAEAGRDARAFTQFAATHPLGLASRVGEHRPRFVGEADFGERALVCIAEVPQGGLAWLMEGDRESVLEATDSACDDAFASLDGRPPLGVLAFDCIARRSVLGDEGIRTEIGRIADHGAGVPVAGFYTYGEIARTRGVSGFHNQTLVVLAVS